MEAINYAQHHTNISTKDTDITIPARKSLPVNKDEPWNKKINDLAYHVTMGSHDGAEVGELVGLYILPILQKKLCYSNIVLYRDDGPGALHNLSAQALD